MIKLSKNCASDNVAALLSAIMYSVELGMTQNKRLERGVRLNSSSVDRQVMYKWHPRFSTEWEESGAKRRSTDGAE